MTNHETCSICLNELIIYDITNCGHCFHKNCINACLERNNKCPICRTPIIYINNLLIKRDDIIIIIINDNIII